MPRVLELFSGTGSVGKCCKELGWDVVSLDRDMDADIMCDIMDFNYKEFPKDSFDIIWASPECRAYSNLKNCWIGRELKDGKIFTKEKMNKDMDDNDKIIKRTLKIINYFKPYLTWWFMENPQTGRLKDRKVMQGLPYYDVDYCKYGFNYKKRTRIWTNKKNFNNLLCNNDCDAMIIIPTNGAIRNDTKKPIKCDNRFVHINNLGCNERLKAIQTHATNLGGHKYFLGGKTNKHKQTLGGKNTINQKVVAGGGTNRLERYRIPPDLIYSLFLD